MKHLMVSAALLFCCGICGAAQISSLRGEVDLKKAGAADWARLDGGGAVKLAGGDELRTGRASTVDIMMNDGTRVKIAPLSAFKMTEESDKSVSMGLYFGRVRSWVKKFSKKFCGRRPPTSG